MSAGQILRYFGIGAPPVDVKAIARLMGVDVQPMPPTPDVSAMVEVHDHVAKILYSDQDAPVRQRFSVAHELGHLMLHDVDVAFRDRTFNGTNTETEANRFAADLLMPLRMLDVYASKLRTTAELARRFQVSEQAMEIRLSKLAGHHP